MTAVVGTLIDVKLTEQHVWMKGAEGHDTWWSNLITIEIDSPKEFAGLRTRFDISEVGPISYDHLKGKKVRLTLPKMVLSELTIGLSSTAAFLSEEIEQKD